MKLKDSKSKLVADIFNQLLDDKVFGKAYRDFKITENVQIDQVVVDLRAGNPRLSDSTLRRASTIRAWVGWMYEIDKENSD